MTIMQTTSRLALVGLLSAVPAFAHAQTATEGAATDQTATEKPLTNAEAPVTDESATDTADAPVIDESATDTAETPVMDGSANDRAETPVTDENATAAAETPVADAAAEQTAEAPAEDVVKPVEGQIVMQSENSILAQDLIGSEVYTADGESIGEVDDLIVNLDGSIDGVVIGVGGFLGLGEKDVAVEMVSLSTSVDEDGNVRLVTSATEADLEAADEFITARAQAAAKRLQENQTVEPIGTAPASDG